jgi:hypothetical protein
MPASHPQLRAVIVGVSVFALAAVAAGGTFAASNPATLYACYDVYGNVRMGDTAQCKLASGGRLVYWSTAGVPGPAGPTGPTGPAGPQGPAGSAGTTHLYPFGTIPTFTPVFSGAAFAVGLGCQAGASPFLGYSLQNLSPGEITYVDASSGSNPRAHTLSSGVFIAASWNATSAPGMVDLWVTGGGDSFHVLFGVIPDSATNCRVIATY